MSDARVIFHSEVSDTAIEVGKALLVKLGADNERNVDASRGALVLWYVRRPGTPVAGSWGRLREKPVR